MGARSFVIAIVAATTLAAATPLPRAEHVAAIPSSKVRPTGRPAPAVLHPREVGEEIVAMFTRRSLDNVADVNLGLLERNFEVQFIGDTVLDKRATAAPCLGSNATDVDINSALYYGGAGIKVQLCPGATIRIQNSIFFFAPNQELSTAGYPTGDTRATIVIANPANANAIYGPCNECSGVALRNIQVNGARPELGIIFGGIGLVELGGQTTGQIVSQSHIYEPRGWSALHAIEGYANSCRGMRIVNNQIGPAGNSPNNGFQFKKKRAGEVYTPGQWADGISLACAASSVTGNTITDATDGGIVIFGAPGSTISGNTIISKTRNLLGGINAVDWGPFGGPYTGTVVKGNTINSATAMIKIGIAIGGLSWGIDNRTIARTFDGTFTGNKLTSSTSSGYFNYGISIAGHENATVTANDASSANFGGEHSVACFTDYAPAPQAFVFDQWTTPGRHLQNNFYDFPMALLICNQPSKRLSRGPRTKLDSGYIISPGTAVYYGNGGDATLPSSVSNSTTVAVISTAVSSTTVSSTAVTSTAVSSTAVSSTAVSSTAAATPITTSSNAATTSVAKPVTLGNAAIFPGVLQAAGAILGCSNPSSIAECSALCFKTQGCAVAQWRTGVTQKCCLKSMLGKFSWSAKLATSSVGVVNTTCAAVRTKMGLSADFVSVCKDTRIASTVTAKRSVINLGDSNVEEVQKRHYGAATPVAGAEMVNPFAVVGKRQYGRDRATPVAPEFLNPFAAVASQA